MGAAQCSDHNYQEKGVERPPMHDRYWKLSTWFSSLNASSLTTTFVWRSWYFGRKTRHSRVTTRSGKSLKGCRLGAGVRRVKELMGCLASGEAARSMIQLIHEFHAAIARDRWRGLASAATADEGGRAGSANRPRTRALGRKTKVEGSCCHRLAGD